MIAKLSRWVWGGAWALAFVAGMVNVVGLLGFEHQAVTHLTGTTTGSVIPLSSSPAASSPSPLLPMAPTKSARAATRR